MPQQKKKGSQGAKLNKVVIGAIVTVLVAVIAMVGKLGVAYLRSTPTDETNSEQPKETESIKIEGPVTIDHSDDHSVDNSIKIDAHRDYSNRSTNLTDKSIHNNYTIVPQQNQTPRGNDHAPQNAPQRQQTVPRSDLAPTSRVSPQRVKPAPPPAKSYVSQFVQEEATVLKALDDLRESGIVDSDRCSTLSDCEDKYQDWYARSLAILQRLDAYIMRQYGRSEHFVTDFKFQSPMPDFSMYYGSNKLDLFKRAFHAYAGFLGVYKTKTETLRMTG